MLFMKTIKVKVPNNKVDFFLELMDDLKLKAIVKEKIKDTEENVLQEIAKEFKKMRSLNKNRSMN